MTRADAARPDRLHGGGEVTDQPDARRRSMLTWLAVASAGLMPGGCVTSVQRTSAVATDASDEPGFVAPPDGVQRRVALVLSSGAVRGFAHLGVLRVLEREGLRPDLVVGTSAGAIVGAMWASGMTAREIDRAAEKLDWNVFFDFDPVRTLLGGLGLGLVPGARLEQFLRQHLRGPIERFPLPFAAVAADMESGDIVPLNNGDAAGAVRASCAVPASTRRCARAVACLPMDRSRARCRH